jgi:hypothetical protein
MPRAAQPGERPEFDVVERFDETARGTLPGMTNVAADCSDRARRGRKPGSYIGQKFLRDVQFADASELSAEKPAQLDLIGIRRGQHTERSAYAPQRDTCLVNARLVGVTNT